MKKNFKQRFGPSAKTLAFNPSPRVLSWKLAPALSIGLIIGFDIIMYEISLAALVFSGPLAGHYAQGVGLLIFGTVVASLVYMLTSGRRGIIISHPTPSILMVFGIGSAVAMQLQGDVLFMTLVAVLGICAGITGAFFLMIGHFRLTRLVRFIPYPVAGGFLAAIGVMMCINALSLMGLTLDGPIFSSHAFSSWAPGVVFGFGLFMVLKRWQNFLILPVSFVTAIVLYHLGLNLFDISWGEAKSLGLLFNLTLDETMWPAFSSGDLVLIDWATVSKLAPDMLVLSFVALLCLIIHLFSFELATDLDLDWNKEFKVTGLASVIAGLGSAPTANIDSTWSILAKKSGVATLFTNVTVIAVLGSVLLFGSTLLEPIPKSLLGGMLFFFGLTMADNWLIDSFRRQPLAEYAILLVITMTILFFGFLEGMGVGILATTSFFAIRLSGIDLVKSKFTACESRSSKTRSIPEYDILRTEGELVQGYRLSGYIFFGSAHLLASQLRESLNNSPQPKCIIMDFEAVPGSDFSAINSLCRFIRIADAAGTQVILSAVPENYMPLLKRNLPPTIHAGLMIEPDVDHALERGEDIVIAAWETNIRQEQIEHQSTLLDRVADEIESQLDRQVVFENILVGLHGWLEHCEYDTGDMIVAMGEPQKGLQFLLAGQASVYDSANTRLHQCGPGDVIEPQSAFRVYNAKTTVIADKPCETMFLTPASVRWLVESKEELTLELYEYLLTA